MLITAITIENFKGIREPLRIEFKPITLLFGPNSAGKSTIVQALHYALEIFDRNNLDPGTTSIGGRSVDLGGFESLIYNHDLSRNISLKIELDLHNEDLPQYMDGFEEMGLGQLDFDQIWGIPARAVSALIEVDVKWNSQIRGPLLYRYKVAINNEGLAQIETTDDGKQVFITKINPFNSVFLEGITSKEARNIIDRVLFKGEPDEGNELEKVGPIFSAMLTDFDMEGELAGFTKPIGVMAEGSALPTWGKRLDFPDQIWAEEVGEIEKGNLTVCLSSLIVGPGELVRDALRKLFYIGPLREIPPRNYLPEKSPDASRWASGAMGWDVLYRAEKGFVDEVNRWLTQEDRLDCGYRVEVERFKEISVEDPIMFMLSEGVGLEEMEVIQTRMDELPTKTKMAIREEATGIELKPQDIGVGISQTLPVIVGALFIKEGILAVEQPELHIHPALQVALGDLFISQVQSKSIHFLLETHSEHLMLRFLRRIREKEAGDLPPGKWPLEPDQLAVYYIEQSEKGIKASSIRVDEEGEFVDRWPKGFFSERMKELF